jgi:hypothetical protein
MGDSIMHMEEIQLFIFDNIHELACQGSVIRRVIKKRVFLRIDFVEKYILTEMGEPCGSLVGDKVDLMTFGCQRKPELCSHNTAASVGRIANNSNTHEPCLRLKDEVSGLSHCKTI